MNLRTILKDLDLSNIKRYYRNRNITIYTLTYDYKPFFEKWNEIYEKMNKKTISKLEDYIDPYKFICDMNRVMFAGVPKISSKSCSYKYIHKNENIIYDFANNLFNNVYKNGFLDKFKEPCVLLKEVNNWEKEIWLFAIPLNKNNLKEIIELKEKLATMFENKEFSILYEIKELSDIDFNINIGYLNRYNMIKNKVNFNLLLSLNKDDLKDKLYKGGLLRK